MVKLLQEGGSSEAGLETPAPDYHIASKGQGCKPPPECHLQDHIGRGPNDLPNPTLRKPSGCKFSGVMRNCTLPLLDWNYTIFINWTTGIISTENILEAVQQGNMTSQTGMAHERGDDICLWKRSGWKKVALKKASSLTVCQTDQPGAPSSSEQVNQKNNIYPLRWSQRCSHHIILNPSSSWKDWPTDFRCPTVCEWA